MDLSELQQLHMVVLVVCVGLLAFGVVDVHSVPVPSATAAQAQLDASSVADDNDLAMRSAPSDLIQTRRLPYSTSGLTGMTGLNGLTGMNSLTGLTGMNTYPSMTMGYGSSPYDFSYPNSGMMTNYPGMTSNFPGVASNFPGISGLDSTQYSAVPGYSQFPNVDPYGSSTLTGSVFGSPFSLTNGMVPISMRRGPSDAVLFRQQPGPLSLDQSRIISRMEDLDDTKGAEDPGATFRGLPFYPTYRMTPPQRRSILKPVPISAPQQSEADGKTEDVSDETQE